MEALQPKLRFPEFDGVWERKKIDNISELTSSKRVYLSDYVDKGVPFYRGKEITELKQNKIPSEILYISERAYNDFKKKFGVPQTGDILMTAVGTLGNVYKVKDDSPFYFKDGNLIWFRNIEEHSAFLEILLDYKKNDIEKTSIGSTQRALTMVELRKLYFNFPSLHEQTKIANFLSSIDEKINLLKEKKALLEAYKKGIMQKIFNQEIRFKDDTGNNFEDWEVKSLGEVGSVLNGLTYSPDDISNRGILVLRSSNIQNRRLSFNDNVYVNKEKFTPVIENDILICVRNGSRNLIGKNTLITKDIEGVAFGAFMSVYRSDYNKFLIHWFDSNDYNESINLNLGATINSINGSDLKKFRIPFPSLKEQIKIANFLSAIDGKIALVVTQIKDTQEYKKGLLQQMFV